MDDLISRKSIVDKVCEGISCNECSFNEIDGESGCLLAYRIDQLPSAQKTGEWIECCASEHWKCSECGCRASYWFNEENSSSYDLDMSEWLSGYCPNCGARMECEEE